MTLRRRSFSCVFTFYLLVIKCFSSRLRYFYIENNKRVLNHNFLSSYKTNNILICGNICLAEMQCHVATFNKETHICGFYKDPKPQPLIMGLDRNISTLTIQGSRTKAGMIFDTDTLYENRFVSADKTILSTVRDDTVIDWPPGNNRLMKYRGAVTDYCVPEGQMLYYDFTFQYVLLKPVMGALIVIELGIADLATIDNSAFSGTLAVNGWSFLIDGCLPNTLCLEAWHRNVGFIEIPYGSASAGTSKSGAYVIVVDRIRHTFSLFDKKTATLIHSFGGVVISANLCPVFSIGEDVNASFTLTSSYVLN